MVQTKMLPTKISIKEKLNVSGALQRQPGYIYIYPEEKAKQSGGKTPGQTSQEPWVLCPFLPDSSWYIGTFLLVGSGFHTSKVWYALMAYIPSALSA